MKNVCQRCGHKLKNPEAIARGYGDRCWEIVQLQRKEEQPISNELLEDLLNRVRKLELDNTFLKHQLKHKTIVSGNPTDVIERLKQDQHRPEREPVKINMVVVVKELKVILTNKRSTAFIEGFRFRNDDVGIKSEEEIAKLLTKKQEELKAQQLACSIMVQ